MTNGQYDQYDANQYYGMALQGETILDIGKEKDIQAKYRSKNITSFKDKIILPGLFDTHNHYFYAFMNFKQFVDMSVKQGQEPQQAFNKIWNNLEYHLKKINQENKNGPFGKKNGSLLEIMISFELLKANQAQIQSKDLKRSLIFTTQIDLATQVFKMAYLIPLFQYHIAHVYLADFKQAKMDSKTHKISPTTRWDYCY